MPVVSPSAGMIRDNFGVLPEGGVSHCVPWLTPCYVWRCSASNHVSISSAQSGHWMPCYVNSLSICAHICRISCRYPCIWFLRKILFIFSWILYSRLYVLSIIFRQDIVTDSFNNQGIFPSYSLPSRFYTVFLYASGEFDKICIIISVSSICTFNFPRPPLSSSSLVI